MSQQAPIPINGNDRLIREPERRELTGVSEATWRRYEKARTAPRRRKIGPNAVGWYLSEITRWQQSRPEPSTVQARPDGRDNHGRFATA